jgi:hypothetical protein
MAGQQSEIIDCALFYAWRCPSPCDSLRGVVGGSGKAEQIRFLPELLVRVIPRSFLVVSHPQADAISRAQ